MRLKPNAFASSDPDRVPDATARPSFFQKDEGPTQWQKEWNQRQEQQKQEQQQQEQQQEDESNDDGDGDDDEDAAALFFGTGNDDDDDTNNQTNDPQGGETMRIRGGYGDDSFDGDGSDDESTQSRSGAGDDDEDAAKLFYSASKPESSVLNDDNDEEEEEGEEDEEEEILTLSDSSSILHEEIVEDEIVEEEVIEEEVVEDEDDDDEDEEEVEVNETIPRNDQRTHLTQHDYDQYNTTVEHTSVHPNDGDDDSYWGYPLLKDGTDATSLATPLDPPDGSDGGMLQRSLVLDSNIANVPDTFNPKGENSVANNNEQSSVVWSVPYNRVPFERDIESWTNPVRETSVREKTMESTIENDQIADNDDSSYIQIYQSSVPSKSWDKVGSSPEEEQAELSKEVHQKSLPGIWHYTKGNVDVESNSIILDGSFKDEYQEDIPSGGSDSNKSYPWVPEGLVVSSREGQEKALVSRDVTNDANSTTSSSSDSSSTGSDLFMAYNDTQTRPKLASKRNSDNVVMSQSGRIGFNLIPETRVYVPSKQENKRRRRQEKAEYKFFRCTTECIVLCLCLVFLPGFITGAVFLTKHLSKKGKNITDAPTVVPSPPNASPSSPVPYPAPTLSPVNNPTSSAPVLNPSSPPFQVEDLLFRSIASLSADDGAALRDPTTPQFAALKWLRTPDGHQGVYQMEVFIQRYAMATLFFSTNGTDWTSNDRWLSNDDECNWFSADKTKPCDDTDTITELNLKNNNLEGTIPPEIGMLSRLETISLTNNNKLSGPIPGTISTLSSLDEIYVESTSLTDPFPSEICSNLDLSVFWADCYKIGGCSCCTECFY